MKAITGSICACHPFFQECFSICECHFLFSKKALHHKSNMLHRFVRVILATASEITSASIPRSGFKNSKRRKRFGNGSYARVLASTAGLAEDSS